MAEWKDGLIQTGIDKLMEYLRKEQEVEVEEAAASLGVNTETVLNWAKSLEESGLAEVKYTARRGRILRLVDDAEKSEDVMEDVKNGVSERMKALKSLGKEKARLERFEDVMARIETRLEEDGEKAKELHERYEAMGKDLEEMEQYLDDLETVEEDMADLEEHIEALKQDMEVLKQIQKHKPEAVESGDSDDAGEGKRSFLSRLTGLLPFGGELETDAAEDAQEEEGETFKCQKCEKEFESLRGLKTHQGMVHGRDTEQVETGAEPVQPEEQ